MQVSRKVEINIRRRRSNRFSRCQKSSKKSKRSRTVDVAFQTSKTREKQSFRRRRWRKSNGKRKSLSFVAWSPLSMLHFQCCLHISVDFVDRVVDSENVGHFVKRARRKTSSINFLFFRNALFFILVVVGLSAFVLASILCVIDLSKVKLAEIRKPKDFLRFFSSNEKIIDRCWKIPRFSLLITISFVYRRVFFLSEFQFWRRSRFNGLLRNQLRVEPLKTSRRFPWKRSTELKFVVFLFSFQATKKCRFSLKIFFEPKLSKNFEFHVLLIQLALLTVSSFMHLYFLLKLLIMIGAVCSYVIYSYYWNTYKLIADNYALSCNLLWIQSSCQMIFFVLLLFGLDRRVRNNNWSSSQLRTLIEKHFSRWDFPNTRHSLQSIYLKVLINFPSAEISFRSDWIYEKIRSSMDDQISKRKTRSWNGQHDQSVTSGKYSSETRCRNHHQGKHEPSLSINEPWSNLKIFFFLLFESKHKQRVFIMKVTITLSLCSHRFRISRNFTFNQTQITMASNVWDCWTKSSLNLTKFDRTQQFQTENLLTLFISAFG